MSKPITSIEFTPGSNAVVHDDGDGAVRLELRQPLTPRMLMAGGAAPTRTITFTATPTAGGVTAPDGNYFPQPADLIAGIEAAYATAALTPQTGDRLFAVAIGTGNAEGGWSYQVSAFADIHNGGGATPNSSWEGFNFTVNSVVYYAMHAGGSGLALMVAAESLEGAVVSNGGCTVTPNSNNNGPPFKVSVP
jgi:hypothetical protein